MRAIVFAALMLLSGIAQSETFFNQADKQMHITGSAFLTTAFEEYGIERYQAVALSFAIGVLKEVADHSVKNQGKGHLDDIKADLIGATMPLWRYSVDF